MYRFSFGCQEGRRTSLINSLNYEMLKGDKAGISFVRVNNKYRVEFTVRDSIEEPIVTVCNIIELSNHYK